MKLLLRSDVDGLGKKGDVVEVAAGYGRNYLVPRGLAMTATAGAERQAQMMRRARDTRDASERAEAEEIAKQLVPAVIQVPAKAGAEGKLFGSVTAADVADAVEAQTGLVLDRKDLEIEEPIKTTGSHSVMARLHSEVQFQVTLDVVAD